MGNEFFVEYIQQTDTTLYFLTLEKVAVSLPTKCLSDPTSGSVFIGIYKLGPTPSREVGDTNQYFCLRLGICNLQLPYLFNSSIPSTELLSFLTPKIKS